MTKYLWKKYKINSEYKKVLDSVTKNTDVYTNTDGQIAISFEDIDPETVLDGVWDKAGRKMVI